MQFDDDKVVILTVVYGLSHAKTLKLSRIGRGNNSPRQEENRAHLALRHLHLTYLCRFGKIEEKKISRHGLEPGG